MSVAVPEKPEKEVVKPLRFVVQRHEATRLHWDFRLEMEGVAVEDHDLDYIGFEGTIPEGEYGAGKVEIWDRGAYELESVKPDKLVFELHGEKMKGRYTLFRFTDKEENWLLFKTKKS